MILICLMAIVINSNAQRRHYYPRHYYPKVYPHSSAYYYNRYANINRYSNYGTSSTNHDTSWMKHFVIFGGGIGGGSINPSGELAHSSFDMDLIFMNVLFSIKLGSIVDTGEFSFSDTNSFQVGALIPIVTFDKSEYLWGQKGKIFIAPLIGFIKADNTYVDGEYFHSGANHVDGHVCQWWIDETEVKEQNCTEYGGALMVKYGCGYLLGKVTNKSWGVSIGLCM